MRQILCAFLFFMAWTTAVFAGDHPFVGVYYVGYSEGPDRLNYTPQQEKLNCAYSFAVLYKNGDFADMLLDKAKFDKTGEPMFRVWNVGTCQMSEDGKYDSCTTASAPDLKTKTTFSNIYDNLTDELVDFRIFNTVDEAKENIVSGDKKRGDKMHARRCSFTEAEIKPYLSEAMTDLTVETWSPLVGPDTSPKTAAQMRAILAAMKVAQP
jgi:hypothetical protein